MPSTESLERLEEKYLYRRDAVINPSLDNITEILGRLGNPQSRVRAIQVTGTNGKTSVSWMLGAILSGQGERTAVYTSPHLVSFRERIRIDGEPVDARIFEKYLRVVAKVIDEVDGDHGGSAGRPQVSGFEVLTAVMFLLLDGEEISTAVLEVGMGGRWDATSLANVSASVITKVALDHTDILGSTEVEIAHEKAQVMRAGKATFTAETRPDVLSVFVERADDLGARLQVLGEDFEAISGKIQLHPRLVSVSTRLGNYQVPLDILGAHQVTNLGLAVACAEGFIGTALDLKALGASVASLSIPGRLEVMSKSPTIVLDGAHNPDAAAHLSASITGEPSLSEAAADLTLVLAILADKDCQGILSALIPLARRVIVTQVDHGRSMAPKELIEQVIESAKGTLVPAIAASIPEAIEAAIKITPLNGLICVTGSLYTVGAARAHLLSQNPR